MLLLTLRLRRKLRRTGWLWRAYAYAHRVGKRFAMDGERDFVVLVDLGEAADTLRYWIIPAGEANSLITNEQIRTKDVPAFENRWDLLDSDA